MDTLGAIVGPLTALWLLRVTDHSYRKVFFWTLLPGFVAVACFWLLVRERTLTTPSQRSLLLDKQAAEVNRERLQSEQEGTLLLVAGARTDLDHPLATFPLARTEGAPDSLPPPACRRGGFRSRRFLSFIADSLRLAHACARARPQARCQPRRRPLHPA